MKIAFHGADQGVTGSCHYIECAGKRILVDCGLYQGGRELDEENANAFGFDPQAIDYLLLTHAHLDHCGRIPLLSSRGFQGEIITTAASRELARLVMLDSANLNEEEARYRNRRAGRREQQNIAGLELFDGDMEHPVVARRRADGDGTAGNPRTAINGPHIGSEQTGTALRFMHRGDAHCSELVDDRGIGAGNVADGYVSHSGLQD